MGISYQLLKDLTTGKDDSTIKVRLTRMWDSINTRTKFVMNKNLILLDEEDDDIHVTIHVNQFDQFISKLHIGSTYIMSNVKVVPAQDTYRPVPGDKGLNFQRKTTIKKTTNDGNIPEHKFHCLTFAEAKARVGNVTELIDVAGRLTSYTELQTIGNGSRKIDILLQAESSEEIKVTLWEDKAKYFTDEDSIYTNSTTHVIVTGTVAKNIGRQILLSSTTSTQLYFNIDHPDILSLKSTELSEETRNEKPKAVRSILPTGQNTPLEIKEMTLIEVIDAKLDVNAKEILCTTEATITEIIPNFGWYYLACSNCFKKMRDATDTKHCYNCPNTEITPTYKYKVIVKVKDATASTTFTLFDRQVITLIGVPVQYILDNIEEASPFNIPTIVNNMVGKKCAFHLKITEYNIGREEYTVTKLTDLKNEKLHTEEGKAEDAHQDLPETNNVGLTKKRPSKIQENQNRTKQTKIQHTDKTPIIANGTE